MIKHVASDTNWWGLQCKSNDRLGSHVESNEKLMPDIFIEMNEPESILLFSFEQGMDLLRL